MNNSSATGYITSGEHLNSYEISKVVDITQWPLATTIWWPLGTVVVYLLTIKIIGPSFMRNRPAFSLKPAIIIYNLLLVLFSFWLVVSVLKDVPTLKHYFGNICVKPAIHPEAVSATNRALEIMYYFYMSKYVELLDTVFFVLRKKFNQASFLHLWHHSVMVIFGYVYITAFTDGDTSYVLFGSTLNSIVHTIMYFYYFLAALGPAIQKYLSWKKYLTSLQMTQFVLIFLMLALKLFAGCNIARLFIYLSSFHLVAFFAQFFLFYQKSYGHKKKVQ